MLTSFHHTGIVVSDLERMVRFYTDDLGLAIVNEIDSIAPPEGDHTGVSGAERTLVFLGFEGGHQIELVHYRQPAARPGHLDKHQLGAMHVCFNVVDLAGLHQTLSDKGVRFVSEPKFSQTPDGKQVGIVYAQDPEGNWLEFIQWSD